MSEDRGREKEQTGPDEASEVSKAASLEHNDPESEDDRHCRLFKTETGAIFMIDCQAGCFIDVNAAAERMYGYRREEFLHMKTGVIFAETDPTLPDLAAGRRSIPRQMHRRKDGTVFPVEIAGSSFEVRGIRVCVAAVHDITELQHTEKTLQSSKDHYRTLFDAVTDALFVHEIGADGIPGNFLEVNEIACERLGYSREELLTKSPMDIDAPDTGLDLKPISNKVLAGERVTFEQTHIAKDGRRIAVEINAQQLKLGEHTAVLSMARDITERKEAERALRESKEKYRLVTELSPNAITVADNSGIIRMVNQRVLAIYGLEHESEAIGRSIFEWVAEADRQRASQAFLELLRNGVVYNLELHLLRRDGSIFLGETNASALSDSREQAHEVIIVTTDITPRRRMEEESLKLQKLESVGRLAGGIAHDFNNLLQGVFGYMSLARRNLDQPDLAADMFDQAEEALTKSINLTSQLLTFAKGGKPMKKDVALEPVLENATKLALAGSRCNLRMNIASDLSPVSADEGQIWQVIQNIVSNASEAMPEGGNVAVEAQNTELTTGEISLLPDGGRFVRITVRDTGIGIPDKYLSKIFDPYFTTKQKGSGLGLATSYSIVKSHDGAIAVQSSGPNGGSSFSIYLPAASSADIRQDNRAADATAAKPQHRILVMDDEEMIRKLAILLAQTLGHDAETAVDGEEAVEKFIQAQQTGRPYDVVILDLTVKGGMGGEKAIKKIRDISPEVKAIVSSGYADNPVVADFQAHGFSAALSKPYRIDELENCLNKLLSER